MRSRSLAVVLLALALGLASGWASADVAGLEAALRLYQEGAFSESMEVFEALIRRGDNDRSVLATAISSAAQADATAQLSS